MFGIINGPDPAALPLEPQTLTFINPLGPTGRLPPKCGGLITQASATV